MKEWTIRIGCVLLGAVLTLGTMKLTDLIKGNTGEIEAVLDLQNNENEPSGEMIEVTDISDTESGASEEVQEPEQNYKLEAELKFRDLIDNKLPELINGTQEETEEKVQEAAQAAYPPNSIEAAPVKWIKDYPQISSDSTLEEKQAVRSSYEETLAVNEFDKMVIENSKIDFSDVKITIMGDSITEGNILPQEEQGIYDWPSQLKRILNCKEVVNMGKGGSTISCCVDNYPMCKRWPDIPADSDIIIVMGGSNDMLFEDKWQFGNIEYELRMNEGTFCGDLDDMCSRMKWVYRDHNETNYCKLLFINPPSTILSQGVYLENPEYMVPQSTYAQAINEIVPPYGFEVIDMYNNNILNSCDRDINTNFVPDGIHCNREGCRIIAEHVASQIIQRIEQ